MWGVPIRTRCAFKPQAIDPKRNDFPTIFTAFSNIFLYRYTPTILSCPNSFFIRLLCRVVRPFRTALCSSYLICLAHFRASQMPSRTRLFSFFLPKRLTFTFRERLCKLFTFYALCVSCVCVLTLLRISLLLEHTDFLRESYELSCLIDVEYFRCMKEFFFNTICLWCISEI